jgi:hypothetical protein
MSVQENPCESYLDCQLPDETYESPAADVVCPNCGRVWEYSDGWFEPTERFEDGDSQ